MYMPLKAEVDAKRTANLMVTSVDPNNNFELIVYCWGSNETFRGDAAKKLLEKKRGI